MFGSQPRLRPYRRGDVEAFESIYSNDFTALHIRACMDICTVAGVLMFMLC